MRSDHSFRMAAIIRYVREDCQATLSFVIPLTGTSFAGNKRRKTIQEMCGSIDRMPRFPDGLEVLFLTAADGRIGSGTTPPDAQIFHLAERESAFRSTRCSYGKKVRSLYVVKI